MTFDPNIPQATDRPSQSQAEILTNFQQIDLVFAENHIPFDDATVDNRGKHNLVTLVQQSTAPATAEDEIALYSEESATIPQLFFRYQNNGDTVQMSSSTIPETTSNTFVSWLPGGLVIQGGTAVGVSTGDEIFFETEFTAEAINVTVTALTNINISVGVIFGTVTANSFEVFSSGVDPVDIYWLAIGVKE